MSAVPMLLVAATLPRLASRNKVGLTLTNN
jgi:hypothetical protein